MMETIYINERLVKGFNVSQDRPGEQRKYPCISDAKSGISGLNITHESFSYNQSNLGMNRPKDHAGLSALSGFQQNYQASRCFPNDQSLSGA